MNCKNLMLLLLPCLMMLSSAFGQGNQVVNSSFDNLTGKVKKGGEITLTGDWYSPSLNPADIFTKEAKNEQYAVPNNLRGAADPMQGDGYAGIRIYGEKETHPRTYLETRFKKPLQAGKTYCVKFYVTLGELSKYAANNIGCHISSKAITAKDIETYKLVPQIRHSANKIYDDQFEWQEICQTFQATGGERYMTIGNFAPQTEVEKKAMRRPRGFTGQQQREAYYYIENIEVRNLVEMDKGACDCEKDPGGKTLNVVYTRNVSDEANLKDKTTLETTKVYFDEGASDIQGKYESGLNTVIRLMITNPDATIELNGHTDNIEQLRVEGDLSVQRCLSVKEFLVAKGVAADRVKTVGHSDKMPVSTLQTSQDRAQNRRVEFVVLTGMEEKKKK